ncbi:MAG: hypothetical protein ACI9DC_000438 [Gammaproteobacteria bacterium]|jgi:uncharacterized protein (DUF924 family)
MVTGSTAQHETRNTERWFANGQALDAPVREMFGEAAEAGGRSERDHWLDTARGAIALILTLDQFPRHIHRGNSRAFDFDPKALQMCLAGVERGLDQQLSAVERGFFYLPMAHAEDLAIQQQGVALMHANTESGPPERHEYLQNAAVFGELHRDIVTRFARFPHRNKVLKRTSTAQETAWLNEGGQRFGQ